MRGNVHVRFGEGDTPYPQGSTVPTLQTVGQFSAVSSKHLANLDVQIASFQRAQTVDKLSEALIIESINKMQAKRLADWPSF